MRDNTQTCSKCKQLLSEEMFAPGVRGKNGVYCRECQKAYKSEWSAKRPRLTRPCLRDGCELLTRHDTCGVHRPTVVRPPRSPRRVGRKNDYVSIHNRLRRVRGPARLLTCAECGKSAEQWAYDHLDPDERTGENSGRRTVRYSIDLDHYQPLCVPCHRTADGVDLWLGRPNSTHSAPVAPLIEFVPGTVDPLPPARRPGAIVDLRRPPERTGVRRRCHICEMVKDEGAFARRSARSERRMGRCRHCDTIRSRARYAANPRSGHRRPYPEGGGALYRKHRDRAIKVYGGRCVWCDAAADLEFDHPGNDGAAHRRVESTAAMYYRISKTGAPLDDWRLQLLCAPCHRGRKWPERRAQGIPGNV